MRGRAARARPDGFVAVIRTSELAPGAVTRVAVDGERVLVVNVDGTFYALQDYCGHVGAPLSKGKLMGHVIECPLHYARFDVRTGAFLGGPVAADVPAYQVRVDADAVWVKREDGRRDPGERPGSAGALRATNGGSGEPPG
jgi:nitrite reductase/ring-hydroxylating ferredoxin subunit